MSRAAVVPDVREAYAAALARKQSRRTDSYTTRTDAEILRARLEGRVLSPASPPAQFGAPSSLGEFLDDVVVQWGHMGGPEQPVMIAIAEAARVSAAAAADALRLARGLPSGTQWAIHENIDRWRSAANADRLGTVHLVTALLAEWERLGLTGRDPGQGWVSF